MFFTATLKLLSSAVRSVLSEVVGLALNWLPPVNLRSERETVELVVAQLL